MKLDVINKILGLEVSSVEQAGWLATEEKSMDEVRKERLKDAIEVKTECVNFLSALM
jgi:hypothetical protein